jgi:hypothetical protein
MNVQHRTSNVERPIVVCMRGELTLPDRFVYSKNVSVFRRSGRGTKPDK